MAALVTQTKPAPIIQRSAVPKLVSGSRVELQNAFNQAYQYIQSQQSNFFVISFSTTSLAVGNSPAPPVEIDDQHQGYPVDVRAIVPAGTTLHGPLSVDVILNNAPILTAPILLGPGILKQKHTQFQQPNLQWMEGDQVNVNVNAVNASDLAVPYKIQIKMRRQNVPTTTPAASSGVRVSRSIL
jgi:hypothetical protein